MFRRWTVSLSPERSHSWDAESGLRSSKSARVGRPYIKQVCSRISIFVLKILKTEKFTIVSFR